MKLNLCAASLAAVCLVNHSAPAQTNQSPVVPDSVSYADWTPTQGGEWRMVLSSDYSGVAAGHVDFNGLKGSSSAQSADARLTSEVALNDAWFVPMGLSSHNFFLGTIPGTPIPDQINTLGLNTGLGYHVNEQWTVSGVAGPEFYRLDSVDNSGIGVAGAIRATFKWTPTLTIAMGVSIDPDRDVPVLPAAGLRWDIQPDLTLSVMFPRSGLDYRLNSKLSVFGGFSGNYTVFRGDNNMGDKIGLSQYNNALGTYRDFRAGAGVEYQLLHGLFASVEGGYSFDRELDYRRIDQVIRFDSAPYVQAGLKYRF